MNHLFHKILDRLKKVNIRSLVLRLAISFLCFAALFGLIYLAFLQAAPDLIPLLRSGNETAIAAYLGGQNRLSGILSTALLAFLQPISIILPGAPIQIAAGVVYGTLKGFLICHIAYVSANITVFYLARVLTDKMERYTSRFSSSMHFLSSTQYPAYMTAMACLIPLIPNGIIPFAAARTKMRFYEFVIAVILGSFFPILIMCAIGKHILHGNYLYAAGLFLTDLSIVIVLTRFRAQVCQYMHNVGLRILQFLQHADPPQD